MKKIIIIFILIVLALLVVVFIFNKENTVEEIIENKEDNTVVVNYKKELSNKYNINIDEIELISIEEEHTESRGTGVWFDTYDVLIPYFIKFKYNEKIITVYEGHDDYYYDELVQAVNEYYQEILGIDKLIVSTGGSLTGDGYVSTEYASFFANNNIESINEDIVKKFIGRCNIKLIVEIDEENIEDSIKEIIDKLNANNENVSVQVMSDISQIKTYREQPNYSNFDYYYITNIDYEYRYSRITRSEQNNYIEYNNYYYSSIDYDVKK